MSKIGSAIGEINSIDELAARDQWVNKLHPLVKLALTLFYIVLTVSFDKYDVIGTAGMLIYPLAVFSLSELSFRQSLKKLRLVLPLVCLMGLLNPIFDQNRILIAGMQMSAGLLSMLTLIMKGVFSVLASYLLIATTSVDKLCYAFCLLHVPKIMVTQFMLTYRYITLLLEEVNRITQAYALRAPNQKGVHFKAWGSMVGQLLLRSMDRAENVYESMLLRGYQGDYRYVRERMSFGGADVGYLLIWAAILALFRVYPVMLIIGNLVGGLMP